MACAGRSLSGHAPAVSQRICIFSRRRDLQSIVKTLSRGMEQILASLLHFLLVAWPWVSHLISLKFGFYICNSVIIMFIIRYLIIDYMGVMCQKRQCIRAAQKLFYSLLFSSLIPCFAWQFNSYIWSTYYVKLQYQALRTELNKTQPLASRSSKVCAWLR